MIFKERYRGQGDLLVFIYNTLFEWVFIWSGFEESVWLAIWGEDYYYFLNFFPVVASSVLLAFLAYLLFYPALS